MILTRPRVLSCAFSFVIVFVLLAATSSAQVVTYQPYIQPGDNGPFGAADQMVVAWQTNESR